MVVRAQRRPRREHYGPMWDRLQRQAYSPAKVYMGRPCFVCGSMYDCSHREAALVEDRMERLRRVYV